MKYIPLKIKVTRTNSEGKSHPKGHNGYDIDQYGIGMHYDKCCDFDLEGFRYAITALPEDKANAYIVASEGGVVAITEAEAEAWFLEHCPEPAELISIQRLQEIKLKKDLGIALTQEDNDALDPLKDFPGIMINKKKGFRNKLPKDAEL